MEPTCCSKMWMKTNNPVCGGWEDSTGDLGKLWLSNQWPNAPTRARKEVIMPWAEEQKSNYLTFAIMRMTEQRAVWTVMWRGDASSQFRCLQIPFWTHCMEFSTEVLWGWPPWSDLGGKRESHLPEILLITSYCSLGKVVWRVNWLKLLKSIIWKVKHPLNSPLRRCHNHPRFSSKSEKHNTLLDRLKFKMLNIQRDVFTRTPRL